MYPPFLFHEEKIDVENVVCDLTIYSINELRKQFVLGQGNIWDSTH